MALQITLVKTPTKVSVSKTSQTFHKQGGTLGRGESNVWVLPDPDKYLSSCHCELLFDANKYYLLDLSTNGTFFNNSPEPLGKGVRSPLADGDVFEVGEYRFAVKIIADQEFAGASPFAAQKPTNKDTFAATGPSGFAQPFAAEPIVAQPFTGGGFLPADYHVDIDSQGIDPIALWDAVEKKSQAPFNTTNPRYNASHPEPAVSGPMFDPVTGAIVSHKPFSGAATDHTPSVDQSITWPNSAQENLIPENWDSMDLLSSPAVREAPVEPYHEPLPAFDKPLQRWDEDLDLLASPAVTQPTPERLLKEQSLKAQPFNDQPFNDQPFRDQPFRDQAFKEPPLTPVAEPLSKQGQDFAGAHHPESFAAATRPAIPQEGAVAMPSLGSAQTQPIPVTAQVTSPSPVSSGAAAGAANNRLIAAMGLDPARLSAEQMDEISDMVGELMRETVSGMMQVLRSRTSIKNEFRMNLTTIQSVENNPLKFSVTVDDALENMFIKKSNAYKKPVEALREGFQEIGEHQVAMIAGIRQGFDKMMQRFDPEHLEHTFNKQGKGSLIPGMQKTKYWSNYCDHYAGFVDNMESSFQHLFGSDFVNAYEDQLRKLAAARKKK